MEKSKKQPLFIFLPDDCIRDLLGFNATTIYGECNVSLNPVDILSFDNIFRHTNIAQEMISKGRRFGIFHNFTMDVDPG